MTGPLGNSEFCFPRISMFPSTSPRATLRFEGSKIHCSSRDQSLSVKCCMKNLAIFKFEAATPNMSSHVVTRLNRVAKRTQYVAPNKVAICRVEMLRSFGRGLMLLVTARKLPTSFCLLIMVENSVYWILELIAHCKK